MRLMTVIATVLVLSATTPFAQREAQPEYLITPHVFEASTDRTTDLIGAGGSMMRARSGSQASVKFGDGTLEIKLVVMPTDIGAGRVALRVQISVTKAGATSMSSFDVLSGVGVQASTVAARDANGRFLVGQNGLPVYATFNVTARP